MKINQINQKAHKRELFESRSSYAIDDVDQQKLITTPFWIKEPIQKFPLSMFLDDFENEQEEERHLVPNAYIETPVNFRFGINLSFNFFFFIF